MLEARYGRSALALGDEGGYVPPVSDPREALELLHVGVEKAGHTGRFRYGLDCAATHFYDAGENTLPARPASRSTAVGSDRRSTSS